MKTPHTTLKISSNYDPTWDKPKGHVINTHTLSTTYPWTTAPTVFLLTRKLSFPDAKAPYLPSLVKQTPLFPKRSSSLPTYKCWLMRFPPPEMPSAPYCLSFKAQFSPLSKAVFLSPQIFSELISRLPGNTDTCICHLPYYTGDTSSDLTFRFLNILNTVTWLYNRHSTCNW